MNTNVVLARTFTKALKGLAVTFRGDFNDLVDATLQADLVAAKRAELNAITETNKQIEALRTQRKALVAAVRPVVALDANGNPVKRGRGRPRKNPLAPVIAKVATVKAAGALRKGKKVQIPDDLEA